MTQDRKGVGVQQQGTEPTLHRTEPTLHRRLTGSASQGCVRAPCCWPRSPPGTHRTWGSGRWRAQRSPGQQRGWQRGRCRRTCHLAVVQNSKMRSDLGCGLTASSDWGARTDDLGGLERRRHPAMLHLEKGRGNGGPAMHLLHSLRSGPRDARSRHSPSSLTCSLEFQYTSATLNRNVAPHSCTCETPTRSLRHTPCCAQTRPILYPMSPSPPPRSGSRRQR